MMFVLQEYKALVCDAKLRQHEQTHGEDCLEGVQGWFLSIDKYNCLQSVESQFYSKPRQQVPGSQVRLSQVARLCAVLSINFDQVTMFTSR